MKIFIRVLRGEIFLKVILVTKIKCAFISVYRKFRKEHFDSFGTSIFVKNV
jgi:hypothetical protein